MFRHLGIPAEEAPAQMLTVAAVNSALLAAAAAEHRLWVGSAPLVALVAETRPWVDPLMEAVECPASYWAP